jgi:hypothetical protein
MNGDYDNINNNMRQLGRGCEEGKLTIHKDIRAFELLEIVLLVQLQFAHPFCRRDLL